MHRRPVPSKPLSPPALFTVGATATLAEGGDPE